jgi:hypothetical protein
MGYIQSVCTFNEPTHSNQEQYTETKAHAPKKRFDSYNNYTSIKYGNDQLLKISTLQTWYT